MSVKWFEIEIISDEFHWWKKGTKLYARKKLMGEGYEVLGALDKAYWVWCQDKQCSKHGSKYKVVEASIEEMKSNARSIRGNDGEVKYLDTEKQIELNRTAIRKKFH